MPKHYVLITNRADRKIQSTVSIAFQKNRGRVPLEELTRKLVEAVGFKPLKELDEGNLELKKSTDAGYKKYEIINGIVYEIPPIFRNT